MLRLVGNVLEIERNGLERNVSKEVTLEVADEKEEGKVLIKVHVTFRIDFKVYVDVV